MSNNILLFNLEHKFYEYLNENGEKGLNNLAECIKEEYKKGINIDYLKLEFLRKMIDIKDIENETYEDEVNYFYIKQIKIAGETVYFRYKEEEFNGTLDSCLDDDCDYSFRNFILYYTRIVRPVEVTKIEWR